MIIFFVISENEIPKENEIEKNKNLKEKSVITTQNQNMAKKKVSYSAQKGRGSNVDKSAVDSDSSSGTYSDFVRETRRALPKIELSNMFGSRYKKAQGT